MPEQNLYSTFNSIAKQARALSPSPENNRSLCEQMVAPMQQAENAGFITQEMGKKGVWLSSDFARASAGIKTLPQIVFQTSRFVMNSIRAQRTRNTTPINETTSELIAL